MAGSSAPPVVVFDDDDGFFVKGYSLKGSISMVRSFGLEDVMPCDFALRRENVRADRSDVALAAAVLGTAITLLFLLADEEEVSAGGVLC
jgi:hypothetical protein